MQQQPSWWMELGWVYRSTSTASAAGENPNWHWGQAICSRLLHNTALHWRGSCSDASANFELKPKLASVPISSSIGWNHSSRQNLPTAIIFHHEKGFLSCVGVSPGGDFHAELDTWKKKSSQSFGQWKSSFLFTFIRTYFFFINYLLFPE